MMDNKAKINVMAEAAQGHARVSCIEDTKCLLTFDDLTREQIRSLKRDYLIHKLEEEENRSPLWSELVKADTIISDEEIKEEAAGVLFVTDD